MSSAAASTVCRHFLEQYTGKLLGDFFSGKNEAKPVTPRKEKWISLSELEQEIYVSTLSVQHSSTGIFTLAYTKGLSLSPSFIASEDSTKYH